MLQDSSISINHYLHARYQPGGRGPDAFDCWGLTRLARHELYGLPLLPSYGAIHPDDKASLTREAMTQVNRQFESGSPLPGSIATCWRGRLCLHVGLVVVIDSRAGVLEINRGGSPRWLPLQEFESNYLKVVYYHDRDLPQHPAR